ncbi:MAG: hypothetical protein BWK80_30615 [Desulfobacteraceae bacterium IS3]|nr:MAG: hypothetical protein BWK80_30615 [Desulfobacteraceae bacterium IS3]
MILPITQQNKNQDILKKSGRFRSKKIAVRTCRFLKKALASCFFYQTGYTLSRTHKKRFAKPFYRRRKDYGRLYFL